MSDLRTKYFIPKSVLDEIKGHLNQQLIPGGFTRNCGMKNSTWMISPGMTRFKQL